jgi:hypothetical protein
MSSPEDLRKRFALFLVGCIGIRTALVYIAKNNSNENILKIMGIIALLIAISFLYLFFSNSRTSGLEVFGDKIWWNNLRPVHAILYIAFAYSAFTCNKSAWVFLALDVIIGLISFIIFHSVNGNFTKAFTTL